MSKKEEKKEIGKPISIRMREAKTKLIDSFNAIQEEYELPIFLMNQNLIEINQECLAIIEREENDYLQNLENKEGEENGISKEDVA